MTLTVGDYIGLGIYYFILALVTNIFNWIINKHMIANFEKWMSKTIQKLKKRNGKQK